MARWFGFDGLVVEADNGDVVDRVAANVWQNADVLPSRGFATLADALAFVSKGT